MDSGNSGSMQSSSGGSEEYDSRAESISAFFNNNPLSHIGLGHGPMGNQQPPPPSSPSPSQLPQQQQHHQSHSSSAMFDPLSNYFDHHPLSRSTNPNSLVNLDGVWSKNLRSEPNCSDLGAFMASSSPSPTSQQLLPNNHNQAAQSRATFPSLQNPESGSNNKSSVSGTSDHAPNNMVRNPKKRSRASRRAPTTVLTTDTTNFRAMVQEFTGIPAPPFTSSPFPRTRLDLFGTPNSTMNHHPHYLLRPFAQKINPPPPPFASSSMVDAIASTPSSTSAGNNNNNSSSSTAINYQLPSELGLLKQQNLLNMQNPILNFQSLLQTPPKYSLPNESSSLKMGVLEEFGLSQQGHVNTNLAGLQNMVSSSERALPPRNENSTRWGEGSTAGSGAGQEHVQSLLRSSINGSSYNSSNNIQRVSNGGPENVAAVRSEGMVESWICSSD